MHTTSRSVVAAARAHPAGVAAPSAVIVTAIVLLTFVASVIVPSISPSLFGGGSAPVLQPNPSQPRHRVLPQHPVPTGPPILPVLPGALGRGAPGAASKPRVGIFDCDIHPKMTYEALRPSNQRIFAHVRRWEGDVALCVHNLARSAQAVELDLSEYEGRRPVEMFGRSRFPAIGELRYLLTLAPRGFYWFLLEEDDGGAS